MEAQMVTLFGNLNNNGRRKVFCLDNEDVEADETLEQIHIL